jgi:UDP-N-acetylmuramoylalanine--D-glutamate ligase
MTAMDGGFSVEGQRVTVVGAARSGLAAAELLARRGARVTLSEQADSVAEGDRLRQEGVTLELGGHHRETFVSADLLVLSPGVPLDQPFVAEARAAGVPVIGEIELASRWLKGRVIAITGTKGKSTTTALTGLMLEASGVRARVGGNIGAPLSAQVDDSTPDTVHVVEVSSFQLETTDRFHPWIAALLNFSADHLDRHATVESYAAAKARVFERQQSDDWSVVNADDAAAVQLAGTYRSRRRWYGFEDIAEGVTVAGDAVVERSAAGDRPLVALSAVRVPGRHILSDVLAASAISRLSGGTPDGITTAVRGFAGLEHAMELAGEVAGVRFVNDSKATNVVSARNSFESVSAGLVAILGGRYKGGDFRDLREPLRARARAVVAIGESAPRVEEALADVVPVERAASMDDAVRRAFGRARPGDTVVLAPACSSFDMFASYAERGHAFKHAVAQLARERRPGGER